MRLAPSAFCDVAAFDACLAAGDTASLEAAIELYRAPLLEECAEEWGHTGKEQRAQFIEAIEKLAASAVVRGDYAFAARHLRREINVEPLRESAHRSIMETLARAGNYTAVDRHYWEIRLLLRKEVHAEPSEETAVLYQRLRHKSRMRPAESFRRSAPRPRRRLPCPLTTLVGRERAIEAVISAMTAPPFANALAC